MAEPSRRGRPRSAESRRAILQATVKIAQGNPGSFTVEAIAKAAGTSKKTIYRWWPSRGHLLLDALLAYAEEELPSPSAGAPEVLSLCAYLSATFRALRSPIGEALRALMVEAQADPEFLPVFRDRFIGARRAALDALLVRIYEQSTPTSRALAADLIFGPLWYRLLVGHAPLDDDLATQLSRVVPPLMDHLAQEP